MTIINKTFEDFPELCIFASELCNVPSDNVDMDVNWEYPDNCPVAIIDTENGNAISYQANGRLYHLYVIEHDYGYDLQGLPMPQRQYSLL